MPESDGFGCLWFLVFPGNGYPIRVTESKWVYKIVERINIVKRIPVFLPLKMVHTDVRVYAIINLIYKKEVAP